MFCKVKEKHFAEYSYVPVLWSSDRLPACPHCGRSPYEANFEEFHTAGKPFGEVNDVRT